jgi:hypothetical protein
MTLTVEQMVVIGLVVSFLAQAVKLAAAWWGWKPSRVVITWVSAGISLVLAVIFAGPAFPAWPVLLPTGDPVDLVIVVLQWVGQVLVVLTALVGFAKVVYDLVLMKVFEKLGMGESKQMAMVISAQATAAEPSKPF